MKVKAVLVGRGPRRREREERGCVRRRREGGRRAPDPARGRVVGRRIGVGVGRRLLDPASRPPEGAAVRGGARRRPPRAVAHTCRCPLLPSPSHMPATARAGRASRGFTMPKQEQAAGRWRIPLRCGQAQRILGPYVSERPYVSEQYCGGSGLKRNAKHNE
uniref:Uncharacterized protein n=1 Tax=Oryza rufipogon TaxID=4529 RepID=A0A0E0NL06_ORYRU